MIKVFTAYTAEVDDIDFAVSQIKENLNLPEDLLKNSVGIISCYADFIDSGVYKAICDNLPFDVVGTTTLANAVPGGKEDFMLTLMVLTGDDVFFASGLSDPFDKEDAKALKVAYDSAASGLPDKPSLILSYAPLLMNIGGDFYVRELNKISRGVANFGTLAVDHNENYSQSRVLYNGEAYADRYACILISGNINPDFYIGGISSKKVFAEKGVVTASSCNQLQTVNNMPVTDYLVGLGLTKNDDGTITGINSFPFIMDLNDGTPPIIRVMFALTPDGSAVCGGEIPVGATLSVGTIDATQVIETTKQRINEAIESGKKSCFLMYSCVGRYFSLGYNPTDEIINIQSLLDETGIPYHLAYSGCEICPVYSKDKNANINNRSHNDTIIVCAF